VIKLAQRHCSSSESALAASMTRPRRARQTSWSRLGLARIPVTVAPRPPPSPTLRPGPPAARRCGGEPGPTVLVRRHGQGRGSGSNSESEPDSEAAATGSVPMLSVRVRLRLGFSVGFSQLARMTPTGDRQNTDWVRRPRPPPAPGRASPGPAACGGGRSISLARKMACETGAEH
jgi:hypothetical protein